MNVPESNRKGRGESEGEEEEELTDPSTILERNVELEVIHREGVGVEGLCCEGISAVEGGGALEGSRMGGVPTTSARRGGFLPRLPRARARIPRALVPTWAPQ